MTRRDWLKVGTLAPLGLTLSDLFRTKAFASNREAKAQNVIMVWLNGGPATIDMWDLKLDAPAEIRGEFAAIPTSADGVRISEHLPRTARVMHQCSLIRSLHHSIPEHNVASRYLTTGNAPSPTIDYPSLGSLAAKLLPPVSGLPSFISFQDGQVATNLSAGYLGAAYNPFEVVGSPTEARARIQGISLPDSFSVRSLEKRVELRNRFDSRLKTLDESGIGASLTEFQQQALDVLRSTKTRDAFRVEGESQRIRDGYGRDPLGESALIARRLIESGVRFVTLGMGGWDTHGNNFASLRQNLLPRLDRVLFALVNDLEQRGLLESTILFCAGEFGRTPRINRGTGRDHWSQSMAVLLAGGGIRGGQVYGSTDAQGMNPALDPCSPDDVAATIFAALGIDAKQELMSQNGRPMQLFREGRAIEKLLA
jgi:hypothetical protein